MNCLFCKIVDGQIPSEKLFEDDELIAFSDIAPQAPVHILVIPKKHIASLDDAAEGDQALLGRLLLACRKLAAEHGIAASRQMDQRS